MKSVRRLSDADAHFGLIRGSLPKPRVERGVPIPPSKFARDRCPFDSLEPGDSFLLPPDLKRANVYEAAKRAGILVEIHKTEDGERCWRIK